MFSRKHYINWFSLIFIVVSILILSLNFRFLKNGTSVLIYNLTGSILLIIILLIVDKYLDPNKIDIFSISFTFALSFLSYLSFFPICFYLIFLLFFFRDNLKNLISVISSVLIFYFLIQLYTLGNYNADIFYWNIPLAWIIILYIFTLYTGWMVADMQEVYFSTGIIIFFWSLILWLSNNHTSLDSSTAASFIISIPFFLSSFRRYKVAKFLGKIYKNL